MCLAKRRNKRNNQNRFSGEKLGEAARREHDREAQDSTHDDMAELVLEEEPSLLTEKDELFGQAEIEPSELMELEHPEPAEPEQTEHIDQIEQKPDLKPDQPDDSRHETADALPNRFWVVFYVVFRYCYFVGVQLIRFVHHRLRRGSVYFHRFENSFKRRREMHRRSLKWWFRTKYREICTPFWELRDKYHTFRTELANAKKNGAEGQFAILCRMFGTALFHLWRGILFLLRWLAPVAGAFVLLYVIQTYQNQTLALKVEYNGEDLGYIMDEAVFNEAENAMKGRIINETYIKPKDIVPQFELSAVDPGELLSVDELTNKLIRASGNKIEEATGLYIQSRFISAVREGDGLLDFLNGMLEKYSESSMDPTTTVQFVKKVEIKKGLYPASSIQPLEELEKKLSGEERGEKRYIVEEEDTPIRIAYKAGITLNQLKNLNPGVEENLLIGDSLLISQSVPFMGVKVTKLEKHEEEVEYKVQQETDPKRNIGYTEVKQEGENGLIEVTDQVVLIDGIETERTAVNTVTLKEAVDQIIIVGGNKPLQFIPSTASGKIPSGTFGWPAAGGSITTGFLGYYGHTGSDITFSGCYGSPVYASLDGQVVTAGWRGAYGYCVIINHGGGIQTLYAHCSKLYVTPGQQVSKGEQIAAIGRTGNATGPHLHFEIRINGTPVNAAPYLYG